MNNCPKSENHISANIKKLNHSITRAFMENARKYDVDEVTVISGRIMGLIYFSDTDVFQKDVEEAFHINRSSVTSAVKLMERRGYIRREPVENDARLKKLVLTDEGFAMHEKVMHAMDDTEYMVSRLLTPEEREMFMNLCDKICRGMESDEWKGETEL